MVKKKISDQPVCDQCGEPMKLGRVSSASPRGRFYECTKYGCKASHIPAVFVNGDTELSLHAITDDMAIQLWKGSADFAKRQSSIRRLATGLANLAEGKQYLSDSELLAFQQTSRILERLAKAAELAKRKKKALEEEEKSRVEQRRVNIFKVLQHKALPVDPSDQLTFLTTMGHIVDTFYSDLDIGMVTRLDQSTSTYAEFIDGLNSLIEGIRTEVFRIICDDYCHSRDDFKVKVETLFENSAIRKSETKLKYNDFFDKLDETIAVKKASNVTEIKGARA